jgi:hypothetical protein
MAYGAVHVIDGIFASCGPDPVEMFRRAGAYVSIIEVLLRFTALCLTGQCVNARPSYSQ